jgi:hypothetical protein
VSDASGTPVIVHHPGGAAGALCGAPFTEDMHFTARPSRVTCTECMLALLDPAVTTWQWPAKPEAPKS